MKPTGVRFTSLLLILFVAVQVIDSRSIFEPVVAVRAPDENPYGKGPRNYWTNEEKPKDVLVIRFLEFSVCQFLKLLKKRDSIAKRNKNLELAASLTLNNSGTPIPKYCTACSRTLKTETSLAFSSLPARITLVAAAKPNQETASRRAVSSHHEANLRSHTDTT